MAFFRDYLIAKHETPDHRFNEDDEAALILFLLEARLRRSGHNIHVPEGFTAPAEMPPELDSPDILEEVKFVAGFVCFFVAKPKAYTDEMEIFREYFTPGFATNTAKQIQLGDSLRKPFFTATLEDLEKTSSLDRFFDTTLLPRFVTEDA
jgi:hypothetical protein